ncbi:MAG: SAM-dependent methyltransferase [Myxococcaceae bacterium]
MKADAVKARESVQAKHVRKELLENQSVELLKTLHLVTRDGQLNADARRKLKQVNHFVGLLQPALDDALGRFEQPVLVDVGSGNAYLGFILYELFLKDRQTGTLLNIESRDELTAKATERAKALGYGRMQFQTSHIAKGQYPQKIHVLTALHACDTATDEAISVALEHQAEHIALVPCCQAEVAQQLKDARPKVDSAMQALFSHPWHRREFGSHLTNVIRALVLEAAGYQVTVTELAGWEHSLKNELILARRVGQKNAIARQRLEAVLAQTGVRPARLPLG